MTISRTCRLALFFALAALLGPRAGRAAGFSIYEQGGRGMGFGGAFTAIADDPSAIFHNPAGLAFQKGKAIYFGGTLVHPSSDFIGADPSPGRGVAEKSDVGIVPVPAFYYAHQFSERLVLGAGIHMPFGLKTGWTNPDAYSGRYISTEAELKAFSINPTIAFKLADRLSFGFGLDVRLSSVELHRRIPGTHPVSQSVVDLAEATLQSKTNTALGFDLGLLARLSDNLSVGASYRHKVQVSFEGTAAFRQIPTGVAAFDAGVAKTLPGTPTPITTTIDFPAMASAGFSYDWADWRVAGDVVYFGWSTLERVPIRFPEFPTLGQDIIEQYENSWQLRTGVERRLGERWAVRVGYFFDQSPAPAASISPLLPDANRNGYCLGGGFKGKAVRLDVGAWYQAFKDRSTEGRNRDNYNGTYGNRAITFGASFGYRF